MYKNETTNRQFSQMATNIHCTAWHSVDIGVVWCIHIGLWVIYICFSFSWVLDWLNVDIIYTIYLSIMAVWHWWSLRTLNKVYNIHICEFCMDTQKRTQFYHLITINNYHAKIVIQFFVERIWAEATQTLKLSQTGPDLLVLQKEPLDNCLNCLLRDVLIYIIWYFGILVFPLTMFDVSFSYFVLHRWMFRQI